MLRSTGLIWPEMTPATSLAAAKARASSGSLNQRDLRSVLSCYGIYASSWSCWCPRKDELIIGGLPTTSGSGGPRRAPVKLELEEGIDGENLGEMTACSRGVQSRAWTARGRAEGDESSRACRRPKVEDDDVVGVARLGEASASAGMTRATRRS